MTLSDSIQRFNDNISHSLIKQPLSERRFSIQHIFLCVEFLYNDFSSSLLSMVAANGDFLFSNFELNQIADISINFASQFFDVCIGD